ncbi:MAG: hypothetical protein OQJ81_07535, partial [Melioribacteraceae bacterium]|nr:hypothetical protein [Melioribacteraceae bacterium]
KRLVGNEGSVAVVYRRTISEMPADPEEIKALIEEGIYILELAAPLSITEDDNQLKLLCQKMELGASDESGRRRPIPIEGSEFTLGFDSIITAIGQDTILDFIDNDKIVINEKGETQFPNIFAGGDATRGADSLINAIGDGKDAAVNIINKSVENYSLKIQEEPNKLNSIQFQKKQAYRKYGAKMPELGLNERDNFNLVHPNLSEAEAIAEAQRCLYCNDVCNICIGVCPNFANVSFQSESVKIPIYTINLNGSESITITNYFDIQQTNQILNIGDFCNECGNCNTFCPTSGAPYITKPKFYLTEESFNEEDNCYYLGNDLLKFKSNEKLETMKIENDSILYESENLMATFNRYSYELIEIKPKENKQNIYTLDKAAEMIYLLTNLNNYSIFSHNNVKS